MAPESVVDALEHTLRAVRPGGLVLDLQVIRPDPVIEGDGRALATVDGEPLFAWADAATAAIDARVAAGALVEEAVDDHDVRKHHGSGAELIADWGDSKRSLPEEALPALRAIDRPVAVRERCRLRRLRVAA